MAKQLTYEYRGWLGPTDDLLSPIWNLRLCPLVALLCLILAETACRTGFPHGLFLGLATGMLVATAGVAFQLQGITLRHPLERSDVDDLSVTP